MNVRKLLDWRKLLIYSHRWMGILFGTLFVSWFISGVAFMYWGMPVMSASERLHRLKSVDLSAATLAPLDAARRHDIKPTSLRIEMRVGRPVYHFGNATIFADTGDLLPVTPFDAARSVDLIREWVPEHAATIRHDARMEEPDQWTLQNASRNQLPLHRIAVGDEAGTYYYVAEKTGNIAMKTTRESRVKGFLSGVLHWVYFTPFRKHSYVWNQFIIWGSFAGGLMCLTGLAAGIWRTSVKGRFRQKGQRSHSPYSGLMRWHHYTGLVFGLVTFTWIISGAFSVNPFGIFSASGPRRDAREAFAGGPLRLEAATLEALRAGLANLGRHFHPREVEVQQFRGELYMTANRPPSPEGTVEEAGLVEHQMTWLARPELGTFTKFDDSAIEQIAEELVAGVPVQDKTWLHEYDNYYRSRDNTRPLPVLRVQTLDQDQTWLYLDPHRASMFTQTRGNRLDRWLYAALHELDIPYLHNNRPLWDIVVIGLSIGGLTLSATTLWPMCKRLFRHGRRLTGFAGRSRRARMLAKTSAP